MGRIEPWMLKNGLPIYDNEGEKNLERQYLDIYTDEDDFVFDKDGDLKEVRNKISGLTVKRFS